MSVSGIHTQVHWAVLKTRVGNPGAITKSGEMTSVATVSLNKF
jgi:hypothetical protein